jgi:pyruvate/2-oxoacid:ferredoxin oxidoreductase alpha subunit
MTKDRSLGITELDAGALLEEGPDKKTRPYKSKGKIVKTDQFKLDGKKTTKGTVFYEAEFYPCAHINVDFAPVESTLDKIKEVAETDDAEPADGSEAASVATASAEPRKSISGSTKEPEDETINLSREEIIKAGMLLLLSSLPFRGLIKVM